MPAKFLDQVAAYYLQPARQKELYKYVFVFPNKRSGRFMRRYLQRRLNQPAFMPRFTSIGAFIARMSDVGEASRNDCIFDLYDAYRDCMQAAGAEPRDFDRFVFWGQILLSDFNDIDRNGVDARALYTNLSRLREISADYLDDEQKAVVREIWGDNAVPDSDGSFWRHIRHEKDDENSMEHQFLSLWAILSDIYTLFEKRLEERGEATSGMQQRLALKRLRAMGRDLVGHTHYVFVGFSSPSVVETLIFDKLRDLGAADFFWDTASPFIHNRDGEVARNNRALAALRRLSDRFASPSDFSLASIETKPDIDIVGVASRTAQAKLAGEILQKWAAEAAINTADAINTAIILPDESLLTALLHSIPEQLKAINITMGMPFSSTAFAAMLSSIVSMQMRARLIRGEWRFFHEDIVELLDQPHIRTVAGTEGDTIRRIILQNNLYTVSTSQLAEMAPRLAFIFRAVDDTFNIEHVSNYLTDLLTGLVALIKEASGTERTWETDILDHLRDEIDNLGRLLREHNVTAGQKSYFALLERTLRRLTITMAGTPLKGLQIMSVAETRTLDFDNVIFLSMNERIFPMRNTTKTMIPNNLRASYGLPRTDSGEHEAAYHFYRLIGRARRVAVLYDSRADGAGSESGEASRFITQLRHLHRNKAVLRDLSLAAGAHAPEKTVITVLKTDAVMAHLREYLEGGKATLSASALKTYKQCGLKFYLKNVRHFNGEEEVTDYMTSSLLGTILHATAQYIYDDIKGVPITATVLNALANHASDRYFDLLKQLISEQYYHRKLIGTADLPVEGNIIAKTIMEMLSTMFGCEQKAWCPTETDSFEYVQGEMRVEGPWQISRDLTINFKMFIDRVDRTASGLRFIDYKAGGDKITPPSVEKMFDDDYSYDGVFQVLAYCEAYAAMTGYDGPIQPMLYNLRNFESQGGILPITIGKTEIHDYRQVSEEYMPHLRDLISEIFDPEIPFAQAPETSKNCRFCPFAPICGRFYDVDSDGKRFS